MSKLNSKLKTRVLKSLISGCSKHWKLLASDFWILFIDNLLLHLTFQLSQFNSAFLRLKKVLSSPTFPVSFLLHKNMRVYYQLKNSKVPRTNIKKCLKLKCKQQAKLYRFSLENNTKSAWEKGISAGVKNYNWQETEGSSSMVSTK